MEYGADYTDEEESDVLFENWNLGFLHFLLLLLLHYLLFVSFLLLHVWNLELGLGFDVADDEDDSDNSFEDPDSDPYIFQKGPVIQNFLYYIS